MKITTPKAYNDNKWYQVRFNRAKKDGKLFVNGELVISGKSKGGASFLNGMKSYYFGGSAKGLSELKKIDAVRKCLLNPLSVLKLQTYKRRLNFALHACW